MADLIENRFRPVRNEALNIYLDTIANRLLSGLPPTKTRFRLMLVESSEINGFSLAGGRVYLTRKLVANAKNEDEVAGVIAHEMGHILTHQFAFETTANLRRLLGLPALETRLISTRSFRNSWRPRNGTSTLLKWTRMKSRMRQTEWVYMLLLPLGITRRLTRSFGIARSLLAEKQETVSPICWRHQAKSEAAASDAKACRGLPPDAALRQSKIMQLFNVGMTTLLLIRR